MKLFFLLGFRNIFRNKRRTFLTCGVISIALASLILLDALILATKEMMVRLQTSTYVGEAQIHPLDYKEDDDVANTLENTKALEEILKKDSAIKAYSPRILASGMIKSSYESQIVRIVGVDFSREKDVSKLKKNIVEGSYPSKEEESSAFIVGFKLAEKLKIKLGERLILTFSEQGSSDITQEMLKLSGVVHFNMRPFDDLFVFLDINKARKMFALSDSSSHEIAINFKDITRSTSPENPLREQISKAEAFYESWGDLAPSLKSMLDMTQYSLGVIYSLVFIFILFAILNTMFMSIFERSFEFGVIKALGTKGPQVAYMVLSECFSIGLLGCLLGMFLGAVFGFYLQIFGISYSGAEFNGISFSEPLRPIFRLEQYTLIPLMVLLLTTISGIYPAIYTARMGISESMRKSL